MGWLYPANPAGEVSWQGGRVKPVRCTCQQSYDAEQLRRRLLDMDGLSAAERTLRFARLMDSANQLALDQIEQAVQRRRGLMTLIGEPGTGKTTLLICAVNAAREANVPAVYTTVSDLLAYLRQAYDPKSELTFDARWETLLHAEVLALDELDEFNTTPWAMERFLRLIDERWRRMYDTLTLCATNSELDALPEKVASRLQDGRAQHFTLVGPDMRLHQAWE
jgi:DNA replication protein DnaC